MAHLSKIVQDMTALNNELNEKVVAMNNEMEALNTENFQAKVKAENVEELEKTLLTQSEEHNNLLKLAKQ
jgi:outer membrane murein-binding lipoprotein Lpp